MDEHIVIDRNRSINVWDDGDEVCLTVDSGDDRAHVRMNLTQARKLHDFLSDAVAAVRERN